MRGSAPNASPLTRQGLPGGLLASDTSDGCKGVLQGGRLLSAGEGAAQKRLKPGRGRGKHTRHSCQQLAAHLGSQRSPPREAMGVTARGGPRRVPPPTPGSTRGTGGRGQPGSGTHHDAAAAAAAPSCLSPGCRSSARTGRPRRRRLIPGAAPGLRGGSPRPRQFCAFA